MDKFSQRLKELRIENKMMQKELAAKLGIKQATFSAYESGKNKPSLSIVVQLAEILNVSTDYLLGVPDIRYCTKDEMTFRNIIAYYIQTTNQENILELNEDNMIISIRCNELLKQSVEVYKLYQNKTLKEEVYKYILKSIYEQMREENNE